MSKLAINGGSRAVPEDLKPLDWPIVTEDDIQAIERVLNRRDFWGKENEEVLGLEKEYGAYTGMKYCLALNSGTAALHACVAGVGTEPGDEIIVPALTFLASATSVLHHNAIPVFVDIDPRTFNIDPSKIEEKITSRTRAIMTVDYQGLPADYDAISALAQRHDLVVIEDSSQAAGAEYKGKKAAGLGDISGQSTMPLKPLPGGGEGGLVCTNNERYRDHADLVRMFGEIVSKDKEREYNAYTMGWNYRISPFSAAIARSQLKRLDTYTKARQEKARYISEALSEIPGIIPPYVPDDRTHVYYIYYFKVDPAAAGLDITPGRFRQAVQDILRAEGALVRIAQRTPIPGQALFQAKRGYGKGCPWSCHLSGEVSYRIEDYPQTLEVLEAALGLDVRFIHPLVSREIQDKLLNAFHKVFDNLKEVVDYAKKLDYVAPWETLSQLPLTERWMEFVVDGL